MPRHCERRRGKGSRHCEVRSNPGAKQDIWIASQARNDEAKVPRNDGAKVPRNYGAKVRAMKGNSYYVVHNS